MSFNNASKRGIDPREVPAPDLADLVSERRLHKHGYHFSITVDRQTGKRTLGVIFPKRVAEAAWEAELADLSRQQGLSPEGHSLERQQARGREDQPVADPATTTRTLSRRG